MSLKREEKKKRGEFIMKIEWFFAKSKCGAKLKSQEGLELEIGRPPKIKGMSISFLYFSFQGYSNSLLTIFSGI